MTFESMTPEIQPDKHPTYRIPLNSKLPLIAGIIMCIAIFFSVIFSIAPVIIYHQEISNVFNNALLLLIHAGEYLFALLTGVSFVIIVFAFVKKNAKLINIPIFMSLLLLIVMQLMSLLTSFISGFNSYAYMSWFDIFLLIHNILIKVSLPVLFLLTTNGVIKTKVPLIILCCLGFNYSGFIFVASWAFMFFIYGGMSAYGIGLYFFIARILTLTLSTVSYLLIAIALSRKTDKEYYSKLADQQVRI